MRLKIIFIIFFFIYISKELYAKDPINIHKNVIIKMYYIDLFNFIFFCYYICRILISFRRLILECKTNIE